MKQLICEMCGSKDLLKQDGVFVCQSCGCKYSVEEARKMMIEGTVDVSGSKVDVSGSTVKVDTAAELTNLYQVARRARDDNNAENAARYYDMILVKDPKSWEAAFYVVYFKAMQCKIMDIRAAANSVANCLDGVFRLVAAEEEFAVVSEIVLRCTTIANVLAEAAKNHYNEIGYSIKSQYTQEYVDNVCAARDILYTCGDRIDSIFTLPTAEQATTMWIQGIELHKKVLTLFKDKAANESAILAYEKKIGTYDPERWSEVQAEEISKLERALPKAMPQPHQILALIISGFVLFIIGIVVCTSDSARVPTWMVYGPLVLGVLLLVLGCIPWKPTAQEVAEAEKRLMI